MVLPGYAGPGPPVLRTLPEPVERPRSGRRLFITRRSRPLTRPFDRLRGVGELRGRSRRASVPAAVAALVRLGPRIEGGEARAGGAAAEELRAGALDRDATEQHVALDHERRGALDG